jgi:hypothetical protein
LAARVKLIRRTEDVTGLFVEMDFEAAARVRLAAPLVQRGFAVEQVHLAGAAVLEQADDGLGPGPMRAGLGGIEPEGPPRREKLGQRERAESAGGAAEKRATGQGVEGGIHSR